MRKASGAPCDCPLKSVSPHKSNFQLTATPDLIFASPHPVANLCSFRPQPRKIIFQTLFTTVICDVDNDDDASNDEDEDEDYDNYVNDNYNADDYNYDDYGNDD